MGGVGEERRSLPPTLTDMFRAERILVALAVLNLAILSLELAYSVVTAVLGPLTMTGIEKLAFGIFLAGTVLFFVWVAILAVRK